MLRFIESVRFINELGFGECQSDLLNQLIRLNQRSREFDNRLNAVMTMRLT